MNKKIEDIEVGDRFGHLVVDKILPRFKSALFVLMTCDCGEIRRVGAANLVRVDRPQTSCGCKRVKRSAYEVPKASPRKKNMGGRLY